MHVWHQPRLIEVVHLLLWIFGETRKADVFLRAPTSKTTMTFSCSKGGGGTWMRLRGFRDKGWTYLIHRTGGEGQEICETMGPLQAACPLARNLSSPRIISKTFQIVRIAKFALDFLLRWYFSSEILLQMVNFSSFFFFRLQLAGFHWGGDIDNFILFLLKDSLEGKAL